MHNYYFNYMGIDYDLISQVIYSVGSAPMSWYILHGGIRVEERIWLFKDILYYIK